MSHCTVHCVLLGMQVLSTFVVGSSEPHQPTNSSDLFFSFGFSDGMVLQRSVPEIDAFRIALDALILCCMHSNNYMRKKMPEHLQLRLYTAA